jgi:hypothetical protein
MAVVDTTKKIIQELCIRAAKMWDVDPEGVVWEDGCAKPCEQQQSRSRKSAQCDKWSFCLTAGTLWPANQERP